MQNDDHWRFAVRRKREPRVSGAMTPVILVSYAGL
jgi:hypothetical protein